MRTLACALVPSLLLVACFNPSLDGDGKFLCRGQDDRCPGGFTCQAGVCVKGEQSADAGVQQDGAPPDGPIGVIEGGPLPGPACTLGPPETVARDVLGRFGFAVDRQSGALAVSAIQQPNWVRAYVRPAAGKWEARNEEQAAQGHTAVAIQGGAMVVVYRDTEAFAQIFTVAPDGQVNGPNTIEPFKGEFLAVSVLPGAAGSGGVEVAVAYQAEVPNAAPQVQLRTVSYKFPGLAELWAPVSLPDSPKEVFGWHPTVLGGPQNVLVTYLWGVPGVTSIPIVASRAGSGGTAASWKTNPLGISTIAPPPEVDGLAVALTTAGLHAVQVGRLPTGAGAPGPTTLVYLPPADVGDPEPVMIGDEPVADVGRPALAATDNGQAVAFINNANGELRVTGRRASAAPWQEPGLLDDTVGGVGATQVELGTDNLGGMHIVYRRGPANGPGEVRYRSVRCDAPGL